MCVCARAREYIEKRSVAFLIPHPSIHPPILSPPTLPPAHTRDLLKGGGGRVMMKWTRSGKSKTKFPERNRTEELGRGRVRRASTDWYQPAQSGACSEGWWWEMRAQLAQLPLATERDWARHSTRGVLDVRLGVSAARSSPATCQEHHLIAFDLQCRFLFGMQSPAQDEIRFVMKLSSEWVSPRTTSSTFPGVRKDHSNKAVSVTPLQDLLCCP